MDLVVKGGQVLTPGGLVNTDIGIEKGKIAVVASVADVPDSTKVIDAKGKMIIPGLIDTHTLTSHL